MASCDTISLEMDTEHCAPAELRLESAGVAEVYQGLNRPIEERAIESNFPFEVLNRTSELESWRKELHRPIYHLHKWWAQRLGSVFRAILVGSLVPPCSDIMQLFYSAVRFPDVVVFDPFMGSGTTIGEALKLGARTIGYDINPVAYFSVLNTLRRYPREHVVRTFRSIEADIAHEIKRFYQARSSRGNPLDVLYYFWVMQEQCPTCHRFVDLFSSYIFATHAYPQSHPEAQTFCPLCGGVTPARYDAEEIVCTQCRRAFSPQLGPARRVEAVCPSCGGVFSIAETIRARGGPPRYRLYAKLVLTPEGGKEYLPIDENDLALFGEASHLVEKAASQYPRVRILPGYNTDQILNYGFRYWHEMFNKRQLLCLSLLAERIKAITDDTMREVFTCFFSGVLEFNNMFASYKGEGTGAVRHLFSHHILKPERTPIEANLWGTPKSSGSFSTLFNTRFLRALDYRERPFEILPADHGKTTKKVFGLSSPIGHDVANSFEEFCQGKQLYLACGDSGRTDIDAESVDLVVTDPPYFDNVNYSQLADFFYIWQRFILREHDGDNTITTRSPNEVQHSDANVFADRLSRVWQESRRVLKRNGLLVFTYHHSRPEGWYALLKTLTSARFVIVAAHPVKGEMSVAVPKHQAAEPINVDIVFVCHKRDDTGVDEGENRQDLGDVMKQAEAVTSRLVDRIKANMSRLGSGDIRVILYAHLLKELSRHTNVDESLSLLASSEKTIHDVVTRLEARL
jgi:putative DNA methylase